MKLFASLVLGCLACSPVSAGFLTGFSGNSYFSEDLSGDAHVSFAVYDNTSGGNWATALGITPSDASGATDDYVYFYQVVNSKLHSGVDGVVSALTINLGSGGVANSVGFVSDTVFSDGAAVGLGGNLGLGIDGSLATPVQTGSTPSFLDANDDASIAAAVDPSNSLIIPGSSVNFSFGEVLTSSPLMFSSIMYFTSTQSPGFGSGTLVVPPNAGSIPVPVPLPATIALTITGLPFLFALRRRRIVARRGSLATAGS